jgi:membrane associated rhomboid family serine protease
MIPLGDVIPVRVRPFVTFAALAASAAAGGPVLHVVASVMALALFGRTVEDRMGHGRFALFVVLCGALAAVAQAMATGEPVARGLIVSGAVGGVVGAYFALYPSSKVLVLVPVGLSPRIFELGAIVFGAVWYMLQVISWLPTDVGSRPTPAPGLVPSWAHLAGIATGAATVWIFRRPERLRVEWWNDASCR